MYDLLIEQMKRQKVSHNNLKSTTNGNGYREWVTFRHEQGKLFVMN